MRIGMRLIGLGYSPNYSYSFLLFNAFSHFPFRSALFSFPL
jgi:hypothetical protein